MVVPCTFTGNMKSLSLILLDSTMSIYRCLNWWSWISIQNEQPNTWPLKYKVLGTALSLFSLSPWSSQITFENGFQASNSVKCFIEHFNLLLNLTSIKTHSLVTSCSFGSRNQSTFKSDPCDPPLADKHFPSTFWRENKSK